MALKLIIYLLTGLGCTEAIRCYQCSSAEFTPNTKSLLNFPLDSVRSNCGSSTDGIPVVACNTFCVYGRYLEFQPWNSKGNTSGNVLGCADTLFYGTVADSSGRCCGGFVSYDQIQGCLAGTSCLCNSDYCNGKPKVYEIPIKNDVCPIPAKFATTSVVYPEPQCAEPCQNNNCGRRGRCIEKDGVSFCCGNNLTNYTLNCNIKPTAPPIPSTVSGFRPTESAAETFHGTTLIPLAILCFLMHSD